MDQIKSAILTTMKSKLVSQRLRQKNHLICLSKRVVILVIVITLLILVSVFC